MRTTPSARHAHSARAAQLVHMLTVSLNLWQEGSTSCGCTRATRLVVVVTILLRHQVRQSDDPCARIILRKGHPDQRGFCIDDGLDARVRRDEQWWEGGLRVG